MTKTTIASIAFVAGCGAAAAVTVAGSSVAPTAHAQANQRWEVFCTLETTNTRDWAATMTSAGNRAGAEGWELVSVAGSGGDLMCFKRPAP